MSASKHTPGPWAAYNLARGRILKSWRVRGPASPVCRISGGQSSGDAEVANARLIAAAPDLLAACNALLRCQCYDVPLGECCPCRAAAEAAINKATGA